MAIWFDPRGKSYAGDHTSTWLKAYTEQKLEENARQCETNLYTETQKREDGDLNLHKEIEAERAAYQAKIAEEAVTRQSEDNKLNADAEAHKANTNNPHEVTKEQVGLDNVENTSDLDKPVSTATQTAINMEAFVREESDTELQTAIETEIADRQSEDSKLQAMLSAEAEARAETDAALQSEIEQESEQRRSEIDTEKQARMTADNTLQNALDAHKNNKSNPHGVTKAQVGLGNADNTADINKPVSTATRAAIDAEKTARENADAELETAIAQKAAKTEVLTKTNTTAFTPSGNYQPATKKYVDDSVSAAGGGDMLKSVYDADNDGKVSSAESADDAEKLGGQLPSYYAAASAVNAKANTTAVLTKTNTTSFTPTSNYHPATKKYVDDSVSVKANTSVVLTKTNITAFTPTGNYHPATKKYVDDSVANIVALRDKPMLTALTPVGTTVGSSGWTGTGEFNTNASSNNSHDVFSSQIGSGYLRLNLKLAAGEDWKDWSAYYDKDGEEFPFYYSEARGLYDGIIPDEGLTLQQAVDKIRWVYRRKPDIMIYGSLGGIMMVRSTTVDGQEQTTYIITTDIGRMWRCGTGDYGDNSDTFAYRMAMRGIKLTQLNLPAPLMVKIALTADVEGVSSINASTSMGIGRIMSGVNTAPEICGIDNWGD